MKTIRRLVTRNVLILLLVFFSSLMFSQTTCWQLQNPSNGCISEMLFLDRNGSCCYSIGDLCTYSLPEMHYGSYSFSNGVLTLFFKEEGVTLKFNATINTYTMNLVSGGNKLNFAISGSQYDYFLQSKMSGSGSYSSDYSGSYNYNNNTTTTTKTCYTCNGTGSCIVCKGTGTYSNYGFSSSCSACGGNGKCYHCHGSRIQ